MKRTIVYGIVLATVIGVPAGVHALRVQARAAKPAAPARNLDIAVYNSDFALVRDTRAVTLKTGDNRLAFADVSRELDPNSVLLQWDDPGQSPPEIVGHSYHLGAKDSQTLLRNEVGKPVEIVRYGENGREASREKGRLLVAENGAPAVIEVDGKIYVNPQGTLVIDRAADTPPTIPQIVVQAQSPVNRGASLGLTYLTRGLSWSADYVATLSRDADDRLDLELYATVANRTGVEFPGASLTLVAGEPNRAVRTAKERMRFHDGELKEYGAPAAPGAAPVGGAQWNGVSAPTTVAESYAYPLARPATVQSEQLTRLLMMRKAQLQVRKEYSYRAPHLEAYSSPQQQRGSVSVALAFDNTAKAGLGSPLPQGAIRVYDPDASGRPRYAGAATLPDTPEDRPAHVTLANSFDVTADYTTRSSRAINRRTTRKQVTVRLHNARSKPVNVRVVQGFYGAWRVASESAKHRKMNSSTAQWTVPVPASGARELRFAVDLTW